MVRESDTFSVVGQRIDSPFPTTAVEHSSESGSDLDRSGLGGEWRGREKEGGGGEMEWGRGGRWRMRVEDSVW